MEWLGAYRMRQVDMQGQNFGLGKRQRFGQVEKAYQQVKRHTQQWQQNRTLLSVIFVKFLFFLENHIIKHR